MSRFSIDINSLEKRQKELQYICNNRPLNRPKTNCKHVIVLSTVDLMACFLIVVLIVVFQKDLFKRIILFTSFFFLYFEIVLKQFCIKAVECYQHYAKESTRRRCICVPSCSEYAILSLKKYCFLKAIFKIRNRLKYTCLGLEYVEDYP